MIRAYETQIQTWAKDTKTVERGPKETEGQTEGPAKRRIT